jgi:hypothetical protein
MSDEHVDTGFASLNVTGPVTQPTVAAAKAPVTVPAVVPRKFNIEQALSVARKVAMNMGKLDNVLEECDLTTAAYEWLSKDPFYIDALAKATEEWRDIKSTQQRVILKAAAIVEDSLLVAGARLSNKLEPLEKVAQLTKVYADIAGLGKQQVGNAPQERVTISIDFGADTKLLVEKTIESSPLEENSQGGGQRETIRSQPEGPRQTGSVQFLPPAK